MMSKNCLNKLDWDSAIAAATTAMEAKKQNPPPDQFLNRGIAR
jgi:hypothetical protein